MNGAMIANTNKTRIRTNIAIIQKFYVLSNIAQYWFGANI